MVKRKKGRPLKKAKEIGTGFGTFINVRDRTNRFVDTLSRVFLVVVIGLLFLIALFGYIAYKLIVLTPEPGTMVILSIVVLIAVILGLILGAYKLFRWWVLAQIVKQLTNWFKR